MPDESELHAVQRKILNYIRMFRDAHGYSPSIVEIRDGVDLRSASTVHYHLNRLQEGGFIRRERYTYRTVVPVEPES
jgi:repressor LexA